MLAETRLALRISTTAYDAELAALLESAAKDLEIAGVIIQGVVAFSTDDGVVTDECTVADPLVCRALVTYVRAHFGSPDDYDRVKASYDEQKAQLMAADGYTDFGDGDGE